MSLFPECIVMLNQPAACPALVAVKQNSQGGKGACIKHEHQEEGDTKGNFTSVVKKTMNTNMMDA
jgi:hypothetical protein